jgi:phage terminase large subunit-like protein
MPWRGSQYEGEFPSLGRQIVEWIEKYLCHGPGDVQGEPIELDDELYAFVIKAYRLDPDTGRRHYRRAFLSRPKGRSKSELAGMLVCAEALGPVRFSHWDEQGEPVGRPVRDPLIKCMATEEGQSGNTYENVPVMLAHLSEHYGAEFPAIDLGRSEQTSSRIFISGGGEIRPCTASNAAKDGGKETFVVFDETHLYVLPELHKMHGTVRRNLRKRRAAEPWSLETSTMYAPGEDSVAEKTHIYAVDIKEGRVRNRSLLFDHRQAPPDVDITDRESILAALREVYGPFHVHMDFEAILDDIWDPQSDVNNSRRYWFNQPTAASDAWLTPQQVDEQATATEVVADGETICLGFDGSRQRARGITDSTALVACRVSDGYLFLPSWGDGYTVWEQPLGPEGFDWAVPRTEVNDAVATTFDRCKVIGFYCDPAMWETYIDQWTALYGPRLLVRAKRNAPLEWWMSGGRITEVVRATDRLHSGITQKQALIDAGSSALIRHLKNARRRVSSAGVQIAKENPVSPKKVDAAVAAILAYEARGDALAAGFGQSRKRNRRAVGF